PAEKAWNEALTLLSEWMKISVETINPFRGSSNNMKNLILVLTVSTFALASAAQAGEKADKNKSTCSASAQSSCCAKSTASTSSTTKSACCAKTKQAKNLAPATARGTLVAQK